MTGAGFSYDALSMLGAPVPVAPKLVELLWPIAFGDEPPDSESALQDVFTAALRRDRPKTVRLLQQAYTVDGAVLPEYYEVWFKAPWRRYYTFNIDNLADAASSRWSDCRSIVSTSGLEWPTGKQQAQSHATPHSRDLETIHLHGRVIDVPDGITFSRRQYATRSTQPDLWYDRLAADLVSAPVVFVGATLDEPLLWEHIELRRARNPSQRELRPHSYLVNPRLGKAKQALLADYNVEWIPLTTREFTEQFLVPISGAFADGFKVLERERRSRGKGVTAQLDDVATLAAKPTPPTRLHYLLGREPHWADISSGVAIHRSADDELRVRIDRARTDHAACVVVTGTAGSGKSTSLMRQCHRLSSAGIRVAWVDREAELSPREIVHALRVKPHFDVVGIDDADAFGASFSTLVQDVAKLDHHPLVLAATRSTKVSRIIIDAQLEGLDVAEIGMPPLEDDDIGKLIDILDDQQLLGVLRGQPRAAQERALRNRAGRQLLVAMYEATSGKTFQEKMVDEYAELDGIHRHAYAIAAVATNFSYSLERQDLLLATGNQSNEMLVAIADLERRGLLVATDKGLLRVRHKLVATTVMEHLSRAGLLAQLLTRLAFVCASRITQNSHRHAKPSRLLRQILNHDFLFRATSLEDARQLYEEIGDLVKWDYHYWLQRGSLEVEEGLLDAAENFLGQAQALAPGDVYVQTESAYLHLRRAIENPLSPDAPQLVADTIEDLKTVISSVGSKDAYPYHVLGAQGLAWIRKSKMSTSDKRLFIAEIQGIVNAGLRLHRRSAELQQLASDLKMEELKQALPASSRT